MSWDHFSYLTWPAVDVERVREACVEVAGRFDGATLELDVHEDGSAVCFLTLGGVHYQIDFDFYEADEDIPERVSMSMASTRSGNGLDPDTANEIYLQLYLTLGASLELPAFD